MLSEFLQYAKLTTRVASDSDLFKAMRDVCTPFLAKHAVSASSWLSNLGADGISHKTWGGRKWYFPAAYSHCDSSSSWPSAGKHAVIMDVER